MKEIKTWTIAANRINYLYINFTLYSHHIIIALEGIALILDLIQKFEHIEMHIMVFLLYYFRLHPSES